MERAPQLPRASSLSFLRLFVPADPATGPSSGLRVTANPRRVLQTQLLFRHKPFTRTINEVERDQRLQFMETEPAVT
jgi:hypothetical protein